MMKKISKAYIQFHNKRIKIKHDGLAIIKIYNEPETMPYEFDLSEDVKKLQSIRMMDFQAKISMLLRIDLRRFELGNAQKGSQYKVKIDITSSRMIDEMPLLLVMKSIMDGINKVIILNDRDIVQCDIRFTYKQRNTKTPLSKSPDTLKVKIYDLNIDIGGPIASFKADHIYIEPKRNPIMLEASVANKQSDLLDYQDKIVTELQKSNLHIGGGKYHLIIAFSGHVYSKDVDNMARLYYPILQKLGLQDNQVYRIQLVKKQVEEQGKSNIVIKLLGM
jgi:hypothetical protein